MLETGRSKWPPLIDKVTVEPGYEAALGAALGEDLSAPVDQPAPGTLADARSLRRNAAVARQGRAARQPCQWSLGADPTAVADRRRRRQPPAPSWPATCARGSGWSAATAAWWRWDGFAVSAGAPTAAAARLQQRNRLAEVRERLEGARREAEKVAETAGAAERAAQAAIEAEKAARTATNEADAAHARARDRLAEIRQRAAEIDSRLGALAETTERIEADRAGRGAPARKPAKPWTACRTPPPSANASSPSGADMAEQRSHQVTCQSALDSVLREARERQARRDAIARDLASWHSPRSGRLHLEELAARRKAVEKPPDWPSGRPRLPASARHCSA